MRRAGGAGDRRGPAPMVEAAIPGIPPPPPPLAPWAGPAEVQEFIAAATAAVDGRVAAVREHILAMQRSGQIPPPAGGATGGATEAAASARRRWSVIAAVVRSASRGHLRGRVGSC